MTHHNLLTITNIRKKAKKPGYHLDGRGLYLRVAPVGSQAWVLRYAFLGKTRDIGLGSVIDLPLATARERAQECRLFILNGVDPIQRREQEKAERIIATMAPVPVPPDFDSEPHISFLKNPQEFLS